MKINRLFEIVYILLNKENITAKKLAAHFEVSTRTIYRDIETLCEAGIPIYMQQGKGGGITLMEHFVLDKSVLLREEQEALLGALETLKVAPQNEQVLNRISSLFGTHARSWLSVDFAEWGMCNQQYFMQIKEAILKNQIMRIDYYNSQGEASKRTIAPLQLCFKHRNWYLKAYCYKKQGMRLFKLGRIHNPVFTKDEYGEELARYIDEEQDLQHFNLSMEMTPICLLIHPQLAYRVYEEFENGEISYEEDGSFRVTIYYPVDEWLYGYLLSFGSGLEVLEPKAIREELKRRLEKMLGVYKKYDI